MKPFKFLRKKTLLSEEDRHNIIWKTHKGKCTPIIWMTKVHITNCLLCLRGLGEMRIPDFYEGKHRSEWIDIFECELEIRKTEDIN